MGLTEAVRTRERAVPDGLSRYIRNKGNARSSLKLPSFSLERTRTFMGYLSSMKIVDSPLKHEEYQNDIPKLISRINGLNPIDYSGIKP